MAKSNFFMAFDGKLADDATFTANAAGDASRDVAHLRVWVDNSYPSDQKDPNGKIIWVNRTRTIRVTCWGQLAREVKDAKKFSKVSVFVKDLGGKYVPVTSQSGAVTSYNSGPDTYQAQDGSYKASWEVIADSVTVGPIQQNAGSQAGAPQSTAPSTPPVTESF